MAQSQAIVGMANVQYRAVECVSLQVSPTIGGSDGAGAGVLDKKQGEGTNSDCPLCRGSFCR